MFNDAVWQFVAEAYQELLTWSQRFWESLLGTSAAAVFTAGVSQESCCALLCRASPVAVA